MNLRWVGLGWVVGLALALGAGGCSDMLANGGTPTDTFLEDTNTTDTAITDAVEDTDTGPSDTEQDVRVEASPLFALKDDPRYLVPGGIAERTELVGASAAFAWIERAPGAPDPLLVAWDVATPTAAPQTLAVPNLAHPRQLAVSDTWLVYVDDRFGDADVFAVERATGLERAIARRPGPAQTPAIAGSRVAWAECPTCVTGDGDEGMEIFELDLATAGAVPVQKTTNAVADRAPAYGTLADGSVALGWIEGTSTVRVVGGTAVPIDARLELGTTTGVDHMIAGLALDGGILAWRPRPVIVNPDIMFPSDVFTTGVDDSISRALTTHVVARPTMSLGVPALAGRAAWLEADASVPGDAGSPGRVQVSALGGAGVTTEAIPGLTGVALGRAHVAFMAPRADNGGLGDVWVLPLTP